MKIYTKTGDRGTTSLIGGERVSKADLRVEAYGTVDELMAFTALLADKLGEDKGLAAYTGDLRRVLAHLMTVSARLAVGEGGADKVAPLPVAAIELIEGRIDTMQAAVPPITKFTLPGGHKDVSLAHVCRTVCRRAERAAIRAGGLDEAVAYLNRLSDYFYLLSRTLVVYFHVEEALWIP